MSEGEQNLQQQIQERAVWNARDFYGCALGRLKGQLRGDRAQLKDLAEQLLKGDAREQVRDIVDSYSRIERSLNRAAHELGVWDAVNEAARQTQETGSQAGQAVQGVRGFAGGLVSRVTGAVGQVAGLAGQALGQVRQVVENLHGGKLLGHTTNESGRTVQRAVGTSGDIVEIILDENGDLVDEVLIGNLTDLPSVEEFKDEQGQTIRTVKEESGTLIELRLDKDGSILDLRIPSGTEEGT